MGGCHFNDEYPKQESLGTCGQFWRGSILLECWSGVGEVVYIWVRFREQLSTGLNHQYW